MSSSNDQDARLTALETRVLALFKIVKWLANDSINQGVGPLVKALETDLQIPVPTPKKDG